MSVKIALMAAATVAVMGTSASAESYFQFMYSLDNDNVLELGVVRSEGDGVVEIYQDKGNRLGRLLGTRRVHAGANSNVRVNVNFRPSVDVVAILRVNGQVVASREYDVRR